MLTQHQLKLLDGKFTPEEAKSVLLDLIGSKINYHSAESFGSFVRTSDGNVAHSHRLAELHEARDRVGRIISHALENGLQLELSGTIFIKLAP